MNLIVLDQKEVLFPEQGFTVWELAIIEKRLIMSLTCLDLKKMNGSLSN